MECKDSLFWPFTQNGVHNCKSGYRFLKSKTEPEGTDENVEQDKALWRMVWSLQIPNKIKNLMRKACRNSLPTKENLVHRTIIDNPICDKCKVEPETSFMPSGRVASWMWCGRMLRPSLAKETQASWTSKSCYQG